MPENTPGKTIVSNQPPNVDHPFSVLGLPIHLLDDYPGWLVDRLYQRQGCHVVTLNAEMTMQAEHNPPLAEIIHRAELVIPDGAGVVLYLRLHGKRVTRCPGIELSEALLARSAQANLDFLTLTPASEPWSIFFAGVLRVWQSRQQQCCKISCQG